MDSGSVITFQVRFFCYILRETLPEGQYIVGWFYKEDNDNLVITTSNTADLYPIPKWLIMT